jgi:hypothetical protein
MTVTLKAPPKTARSHPDTAMISTRLYKTCSPRERESIERLLEAIEALEPYGYVVGVLSPSDVTFTDDEITIEEGRRLLDHSRDQIHEHLFQGETARELIRGLWGEFRF